MVFGKYARKQLVFALFIEKTSKPPQLGWFLSIFQLFEGDLKKSIGTRKSQSGPEKVNKNGDPGV